MGPSQSHSTIQDEGFSVQLGSACGISSARNQNLPKTSRNSAQLAKFQLQLITTQAYDHNSKISDNEKMKKKC